MTKILRKKFHFECRSWVECHGRMPRLFFSAQHGSSSAVLRILMLSADTYWSGMTSQASSHYIGCSCGYWSMDGGNELWRTRKDKKKRWKPHRIMGDTHKSIGRSCWTLHSKWGFRNCWLPGFSTDRSGLVYVSVVVSFTSNHSNQSS